MEEADEDSSSESHHSVPSDETPSPDEIAQALLLDTQVKIDKPKFRKVFKFRVVNVSNDVAKQQSNANSDRMRTNG